MSDIRKYTVGWICALSTEFVAAQAFLDEEHDPPQHTADRDDNSYALGKMGGHNVVIATLPEGEYGTTSAAVAASHMLNSFPNIRIGLMVGIGGGSPRPGHDVRLGDIVVGIPKDGRGGVFAYDFGKTIQNQSFQETGHLDQPPRPLRTAVATLKSHYELKGHRLVEDTATALQKIKQRRKYRRPEAADRLYKPHVTHPVDSSAGCVQVCSDDLSNLVIRDERDAEDEDPMIHYGLIASGDRLIKDAVMRDKLASEKGVLCFEMEAAGLVNHFPCLIIRGICDYADSHKNKEWQGFAAMMAAAYANALLGKISPKAVEDEMQIRDVLHSVQQGIELTQRTAEQTNVSIMALRNDQLSQKIEAWLSPKYSHNASLARDVRHEESGEWFLQSDVFNEWKRGLRQHLWLNGGPGCGKTVLSTTISDHLLADGEGFTTLTFCFDFNDHETQTVEGLTRTLLHQLYKCSSEASSAITNLYHAHKSISSQHQAFRECLRNLLKTNGKTRVILDALDECNNRQLLVKWFQDVLCETSLHHVRIIATSRLESEFEEAMPVLFGQDSCITLDKAHIDKDIASYVTSRLHSSGFKRWQSTPKVLQDIREVIAAKADGMFRWASCQVDSLEGCIEREEVENTLAALPKDLNETYARILDRLTPIRRKKTIRLLQFLVYAERPLTLPEAVDMLAVQIDTEPRRFDPDYRMPRWTDITACCPSLASIVYVSRDWPISENIGLVAELHLAHLTVKEFFLCQEVPGSLVREAHMSIGMICLTYLSSVAADLGEPCTIDSRLPLGRFAADCWMDHVARAEDTEGITMAAERFLSDETKIRAWRTISQDLFDQIIHKRVKVGSGLCYACLGGLTTVIPRLLSRGFNADAKGEEHGSALQAAAMKGHGDIVQLLLDNGADVNIGGGRYGCALSAAAECGHFHIVQLLTDNGASVNSSSGPCGTALSVAASRGHYDVLKTLLESGADVELHDQYVPPALHVAAANGYIESVRLLLANGAKINQVDKRGMTALHAAVGRRDIIQLLLDGGADVNFQAKPHGNALLIAIETDSQDVAHLLIDRGSDVHAQGGTYGNALQASAAKGLKELVQRFLDEGVDVNVQGGYHGTALQAACDNGFHDIAQLLLENGADANLQGGFWDSALQAACYHGFEEIVQLLLENGADVNLYGGKYGSPLEIAIGWGHLGILRLLIEAGMDMRDRVSQYNGRTNYYHGNMLQAAAFGGFYEIVQQLVSAGAAINAHGGHYGNALHAASAGGHRDIIGLLVGSGAEINAQGGHYGNALQAASHGGHEEAVRLILDADAAVNAEGGEYGTALQAVACQGHEGIVQRLLDNGADFTLGGGQYGSVFHAACYGGCIDLVHKCLSIGFDPDSKSGHFGSALSAASAAGPVNVARLLLSHGANLNLQDDKHGSALHIACANEEADLVRLLLEDPILDMTMTDKDGLMPLHWASWKGCLQAVKAFAVNGVNLSVRTPKGYTAMHLASEALHPGVVKLLIDQGCDVSARTTTGSTPLHLASAHDYAANHRTRYEVLELLESTVQLLIDAGADVSAVDNCGKTPLHSAAEADSPLEVTDNSDCGRSKSIRG